MAFFQPAPPIARIGMRRLAQQVSRLSSPATFSTSTSTATSPFVCRQCLRSKVQSKPPSALLSSVNQSRILGGFRAPASFSSVRRLNTSNTKNTAASPTFERKAEAEPAADTKEKSKSRTQFFPETSSKSVAYWLLGSAVSVFGIVVWGGLTRLTESGYVQLIIPFPLAGGYLSGRLTQL